MKKKASSLRMRSSVGLLALFFAGLLVAGAFGEVSPITISTSTGGSAPAATSAADSTSTTIETTASTTTTAPATTAPATTAATTTDGATSTVTSSASSGTTFSPTLTSDQADYLSGSTVTLTGASWGPGEAVHVFVNDSSGQSWTYDTNAVADLAGGFTVQFQLPNWFVATYSATATGSAGETVTTTFTDAVATTTTIASSSNPSQFGQSVTFSVTVSSGGSPVTTGTVDLRDGTTNCKNQGTLLFTGNTLNPQGRTTFSISSLSAGSHLITACYMGTGSQGTGDSSADLTQVVNAQQATALTTIAASGTFGGTISLSATLTAGGSAVTGKTISFTLNGASAGTATTNASGVATLSGVSLGSIAAGTYASGVGASFAGDASFAASSATNTLTVAKAGSTTVITCPASVTYTGSALTPCTATVTGAGGLSLTPTPSYSNNTNAGTATASFTYAGDANHNSSSDSKTFTVDKAASTTTVSCPASVTYTGSALTPCTATVTGTGGLSLTPTPSYSNNTNVGTATASASFAGDANHNGSSDSKSFAISKATSTTTVTCSPTTVTYDGSAKTPCTATVTGAGGLNQSLTVTYSNNTNAGTASASASFPGDANHDGSSDSKNFTIAKADAIIVVTPYDVTYDGSPHTAAGSAHGVESSPANLSGLLHLGGTTHTNAGTYNGDPWTFDGNGNYNAASRTVDDHIPKANAVISVTPYHITYDGSPHTAVGSAGGVESSPADLGSLLHLGGTTHTDAGDYTADAWTFDGNANYNAAGGTVHDQIDKAATTTTVTCPASVTYTGSARTPCSAAVTGAGGLSQSLTVSYSNNTNAGTASASASFPGDANREPSSDSADFTIDKAESTTLVVCSPTSLTYTGSALEPCVATFSGAGLAPGFLTVHYADNTDAGTATASAGYDGDANHTGSSDSTTFEIAKASSATVVTCPASVVYTGSAQTPCSASVTGAGGLDQALAVIYGANVDAGLVSANASFGGDANHLPSSDSNSFTIEPADSVTSVSCPANVTFDGSAQEPCSASVTGAGGLSLPVLVTYSDNVDAGTATASASYPGDANHNASSDSKTFTIDKASSTTTVTCPANVTYTGSAQEPCTAAVTGAGSLNHSLSVTYSANTNAGTATASASYAGDANHDGSSNSTTFEITKASSTTTVSCPTNVTYTGSPLTPCNATVTGAGGLSLTPDPIYADNTNAGTATASYTYAGDANHTGSSDAKSFTIDKASSTTTVTCPANVTYSGSPLMPCTATVAGAGSLSLTPDPIYSDNTNAGTAAAAFTFAGDDNHTGSSDSKTFTIDKAGSTTVVTCPAHVTYTGSALEPCSASVTGAGGLSLTPSPTYSANTDAGTASASASYAGDANHTGSSDSKTFAIDKASSTTTLTCPANVTYDGSAQTPCLATVSGAGGLSNAVPVTYSANTSAGTAHAEASFAGDANHEASSDSKTFTIDKASSTTTVSCPTSVTYTGSPLAPCTASVTGAGGLSSTPTPSYSDNTDAGTGTASASFAGDANHTGSSGSKTFAIDKASSTTAVSCPASVTYTGSPLTPCTASVTGAGGLSLTPSPTYSANTDAGTASASASYAGDANHTGSSDSKTFTIDKAGSATAITCPASVTYDGSPKTPCTAKATGAGGLNQSLAVSHSNNTNAGTANASASFPGDANHTGSSDSKTFTIDKAPQTITFAGPADKVIGAPDFAVSATGGASGNPVTFTAGPGSVCTISGTTVHLVGVGSCAITAAQAGSTNYLAAGPVTRSFAVNYAATGTCNGEAGHTILQPINATGTISVFKQGSTVPAKFRVCDAAGRSVGTPGLVTAFQQLSSDPGVPTVVNESVDSTTPDTAFRWDPTGQLWIFNMSTKGLKANTIYRWRITLNDGSTIEFTFALK